MTQATHTPGPWGYRKPPGPIPNVKFWIDANGIPVADVKLNGQPEANARLMASSPELLAALKAVVSVADRATVEFDMARAAIAKAEGKTP